MNIEFKVVNHAANLNRTLSFDSDGHNILTKFMNCNNPLGVCLFVCVCVCVYVSPAVAAERASNICGSVQKSYIYA